MTGHTGGKWVVREQENSFTIGQEHDGGRLIAETAPFFGYLGAAAKERARADAELIANAPEMDARIKDLEQQRDELLAALGWLVSASLMSVTHDEYAAAFDAARSAIANAKGAAK